MTCKYIRKNAIISRYIDGTLSAAEADTFTIHCLHCRTCYQVLIREEQLAAFFQAGHGHELLTQAPAKRRLPLSVRRLSWSMAIMAPAILAVVLLFLPARHTVPKQYLALAEFKAPHYAASLKRGDSGASAFYAQFTSAMEYYLKAQYKDAAAFLQHAVALSPQNCQALFFLAISQLLSGQTEKSVTNLKKIIVLPANPYSEEAYWYLGKAYLKMGKISAAREQFTAVLQMGKKFSQQAEEMLKALK